MTQQRFPAGSAPQIRVSRIGGDLSVTVWDEDAILLSYDEGVREVFQDGDTLTLNGCDGELTLRIPARTVLSLSQIDGDVAIEGAHRVELDKIGGDVHAEHLAELHLLGKVSGDLQAEAVAELTGRGRVGGDVALEDVGQVALAKVDGDLHVERAAIVTVEHVGGNLSIEGLDERLNASAVGGDLTLESAVGAIVTVGSVGGDLKIEDGLLSKLQIGTVGGDADLDDDCEVVNFGNVGGSLSCRGVTELVAGNIGGDLEIERAAGRVESANVGGDVEIRDLAGNLELGNVGGDLELRGEFPPDTRARARIGGDARVVFRGKPNLILSAVVSGAVHGVPLSGDGRKSIGLIYGECLSSIDLTVGGDLEIVGGAAPSSSSIGSVGGIGNEFGRDWAEFGREMGALGRELGKLGQELGQEIAAAFADEGAKGAAWGEELSRKMEEKARKMEEKARKMEARAEGFGEPRRVRVKINDREWTLDPERLERIKEQARRAAADGLSGALEAVERAIGRLRVPHTPGTPPAPPAPGVPPVPPVPPDAPDLPDLPDPPRPPATGQTIKIQLDVPADPPAAAPANPEQEREAILRMIAEGRISPEEGDLLLDALGS